MYSSTFPLTSALDGGGGQRHALISLLFLPGKIRYPFIGDCVGPRAGLDGCGKSRTVQPVASRYNDWAIQAHFPQSYIIKFRVLT